MVSKSQLFWEKSGDETEVVQCPFKCRKTPITGCNFKDIILAMHIVNWYSLKPLRASRHLLTIRK